jgi:hypothetical protein
MRQLLGLRVVPSECVHDIRRSGIKIGYRGTKQHIVQLLVFHLEVALAQYEASTRLNKTYL